MVTRSRRMLAYGAAALAGVGVVAWFGRSSGPPKTPIERISGLPGNMPPKLYYDAISKQVGWGSKAATQPTPLALNTWNAQKAEFDRRMREVMTYLATLPPEQAKKAFGGAAPSDASKQSFLVYRPGHGVAGAQLNGQPWGWYLTDEFGRPFEGWGYGGSALGGVLPIVQTVLPFIPGIGTAGGAALGAAIAIGQGKSVKDIGLSAARGALPPYATMAFDVGVAVASGESVQDATLSASLTALEERYPGSRDAFEKGKKLYAEAK